MCTLVVMQADGYYEVGEIGCREHCSPLPEEAQLSVPEAVEMYLEALRELKA